MKTIVWYLYIASMVSSGPWATIDDCKKALASIQAQNSQINGLCIPNVALYEWEGAKWESRR